MVTVVTVTVVTVVTVNVVTQFGSKLLEDGRARNMIAMFHEIINHIVKDAIHNRSQINDSNTRGSACHEIRRLYT